MNNSRIIMAFCLCILLISGLACSQGEGETEPTPTPTPSSSKPSAPTLLSPNNAVVIFSPTITFQWDPVVEATSYSLVVTSDPTASMKTAKFNANVGLVTEKTLSGFPQDGTSFYWWVWAINAAGQSSWPDVHSNGRNFINK